jgi:hypothetical protein
MGEVLKGVGYELERSSTFNNKNVIVGRKYTGDEYYGLNLRRPKDQAKSSSPIPDVYEGSPTPELAERMEYLMAKEELTQ